MKIIKIFKLFIIIIIIIILKLFTDHFLLLVATWFTEIGWTWIHTFIEMEQIVIPHLILLINIFHIYQLAHFDELENPEKKEKIAEYLSKYALVFAVQFILFFLWL